MRLDYEYELKSSKEITDQINKSKIIEVTNYLCNKFNHHTIKIIFTHFLQNKLQPTEVIYNIKCDLNLLDVETYVENLIKTELKLDDVIVHCHLVEGWFRNHIKVILKLRV